MKQLPARDVAWMWHSSRLVQGLGHVVLCAWLQSKACNTQGHPGQDEVSVTEASQTQKQGKAKVKFSTPGGNYSIQVFQFHSGMGEDALQTWLSLTEGKKHCYNATCFVKTR